jgi:hypothetical protein
VANKYLLSSESNNGAPEIVNLIQYWMAQTMDGQHFTRTQESGPSDPPGNPQAPTVLGYSVAPGEIYDAEVAISTEIQTQIMRFEELRDWCGARDGWMFEAQSEVDYIGSRGPTDRTTTTDYGRGAYVPDNVRNGPPKSLDPSPDAQKAIHAQIQLLQSVGSTLHLVGVVVGLLNDSGQMYTAADRGSWIEKPEY